MPSFFQLVLPGCQPLRVAVKHETALSEFIDIAMENRMWFPIADISTTSCGSLVVGEKWKEWTLDQFGVRSGDTVVMKPGVPDSIHASLFCPEQFEALLTNIVELRSDDWNWESIQKRIREKWKVRRMFECMQRTSLLIFSPCLSGLSTGISHFRTRLSDHYHRQPSGLTFLREIFWASLLTHRSGTNLYSQKHKYLIDVRKRIRMGRAKVGVHFRRPLAPVAVGHCDLQPNSRWHLHGPRQTPLLQHRFWQCVRLSGGRYIQSLRSVRCRHQRLCDASSARKSRPLHSFTARPSATNVVSTE